MKLLTKPYFIGAILIIGFLSYVILDIANDADYTPKLHIDIMFGIVTIMLSVAIAISAILQTIISQRNIKLQLFDKRYKVFETIVSSSCVVSERNYSNQILSIGLDDPNFINKKVMESVEKMHDAAILSQTLFDKELSAKIFKAYTKYKALAEMHFGILKQHIYLIDNPDFKILYQTLLITTDDNEIARIERKLNNKFPTFQPMNNQFNLEVAHFNEWVEESGLYKAFDKYLIINELDQV